MNFEKFFRRLSSSLLKQLQAKTVSSNSMGKLDVLKSAVFEISGDKEEFRPGK